MRQTTSTHIGRDALFGARLDGHVHRGMVVWMLVHFALMAGHLVMDGRVSVFLAHLVMLALAAMIVARSRDCIETIIFTHVFWMFSAMTYLNATLNGQAATTGLIDAERAALIALVSQLGLFVAHHFSPRSRPLDHVTPSRRAGAVERSMATTTTLAVIGVAGLMLQWAGVLPTAYSESMMLFLYLAIGARIVAQGRLRLSDPLILVSVVLIAMTVVGSNSRTDLISFVIALGFVWVMIKARPFNVLALLLGYVALRLLSAFSSVIISVRPFREEPSVMRELFVDRFFSVETWRVLTRPGYDHAADLLHLGTKTTHTGFFSDFFSGAEADMLDRLTLLPRMDIVTGRWPIDADVRWYDLWEQLFWTVLPNIGQSKNLIYSDHVVWDLGLRARDSVGRPMITAEAELYVMGGLPAVIIVIPLCFWIMNQVYRWIVRMTGLRVMAILVMSQFFINSILSTTALSTVLGTVPSP
ncbi:MAG: hypothetical protein AAFN59_08805, partial [Pseudomonadota bacterium]